MAGILGGKYERREDDLIVDTRTFGQKMQDHIADETTVAFIMIGFAILTFAAKHLTEFIFLLAVFFFFYARSVQKKVGLALRIPKSSGLMDPKELNPKDRKASKAAGIIYMGNDDDTGEEVWLSDNIARTHMLFMGTTGSGKTEYLVSLVYSALIHGSGFIYVDGKADSSLYGKVYSMARSMGREDDVLVINFQTGAKDIYGAQPNKLSNTLNPFAVGSSGMLSELVKGLMATGEKSTWTQQAESFVEALLKPLVFLRDNYGLNLDVNVIREFFDLNMIEDLAWKYHERYPKIVEHGILDGIRAYLTNKPGYNKDKYHDQGETTHEQHGYITMQLGRTFNSLSDTYGYIMKTPLAEIDFVDVFLNRRILVVLLPALEKAPTELTNLGRIVVASIKATMAKGLGSTIEGDWAKVISSKPTNSPSPFMCVLDEYGYYAVEGFAVVPAQARSLGFSAIFAGQDLPAFEKASKEEAKSTLANTNTKLCGKLECIDTFNYFKSLGGQGLFTRTNRYDTDPGALVGNGATADSGVSVDRMDRVSLDSLRGQISGEWNLFYGNAKIRVKSFFANPKEVKTLRVNRFIKVGKPSHEEVLAYRAANEKFVLAIKSPNGVSSLFRDDENLADISTMLGLFDTYKSSQSLRNTALALGAFVGRSAANASSLVKMDLGNLNSKKKISVTDFEGDGNFDVLSKINPTNTASDTLWRQAASQSMSEVDQDTAYSSDFDMNSGGRDVYGTYDKFLNGTNLFAGDEVDVPDAIESIDNDISPDAMDIPPNVDAVTGEIINTNEFLRPAATQGMLNRSATVDGLMNIEMAAGFSTDAAQRSAAILAGDIGDSSKYPGVVPSEPTIGDFEKIANQLCGLLEGRDN